MIESQFVPFLGFWLFEGLDLFQTTGSFLPCNRKLGQLRVALLKFLFFGHVNLRRKRKLTAVTDKNSFEATYIFRRDRRYKIWQDKKD